MMGRRLTDCRWVLITTISSLFITGCSNEQVYNAIHAQQKSSCSRQSNTVYQECLNRLNKPYKEYEYERVENLEDM